MPIFESGWHNFYVLRGRVFRLTEASSLRLDSPRTSPWNKTVKLFRHPMIVASYPMNRPLAWCQTWWNQSWHSHLKSALFCIHWSARHTCAYISCHFAHSEYWCLVAPLWDQLSGIHCDVWQLGNFSIHRIAEGPDGLRRTMQRQNLDSRNNEHRWGSYSTPVLTESTYKITRLVSN